MDDGEDDGLRLGKGEREEEETKLDSRLPENMKEKTRIRTHSGSLGSRPSQSKILREFRCLFIKSYTGI